MKVTYLQHSGFVVELTQHVLVFDYWKGTLPEFDKEKVVLVFVSHAHEDHFNPEIFSWAAKYPKIHFFLSNDIKIKPHPILSLVGPDQKGKAEDFTVETIGSTDQGVAFIVNIEGKSIFHAGDLNWWTWGDQDTMEEYLEMTANYLAEINKIEGRHFDLAFMVLDPRLNDRYGWGLERFLQSVDCNQVIPMHLWEKYETIDRFMEDPAYEKFADRIIKYQKPGELIILPD
ncbi:MAG: MBL fold metallo-hydrolase [Lachnospiraceae bacterium]|nr:MBL fold metallo-hydrolase [Lachnospiraceae bacterium]